MKSLISSFEKTGSLHHAYILEGLHDNIFPKLCDFCEKKLKFETKANPDFHYEIFERFTIADARHLHEMQMRKTTDRGKKIFIISFNFITKEAQNALLKVLEEPTKGTHFFFIINSTKRLLDTVLSRVVCITENKSEKSEIDNTQGEKFISLSYKDRMIFISKFVEDIKNEKKSRGDVMFFLQLLEEVFHKKLKEKPTAQNAQILKEVSMAEKYIHDHGSSAKQLLEHVALMV